MFLVSRLDKSFHLNKIRTSSDWRPIVSQYDLEVRAKLYSQIREYFAARDVLEVDTPIMNVCTVSDPNIESICVHNVDVEQFLHTSPEYAMKRMLACFKRDIYQLCKVFRAGEQGKFHHPEFTMLEWYRVGWNYQKLMREVDELVKILLNNKLKISHTIFITYQDIFINYCELDPLQANQSDYIRVCRDAGIGLNEELSDQEYQDLLLDQVVAPQLPKNQLTFIYDFPIEHAALAKINNNDVAERFELYCGDIELANGFQELTDAREQLKRFESNNFKRKQVGKIQIEIDKNFLDSLNAGLPECAGVALGIDRLLMLILGVDKLENVLTFPKACS